MQLSVAVNLILNPIFCAFRQWGRFIACIKRSFKKNNFIMRQITSIAGINILKIGSNNSFSFLFFCHIKHLSWIIYWLIYFIALHWIQTHSWINNWTLLLFVTWRLFVGKVLKIEIIISQAAEASGRGSYTTYRHIGSQETSRTKTASGNMTVTQSSFWVTSKVSRIRDILCTRLYKLSPLPEKTTHLRWDCVIYIAVSLTRRVT